jgi:hypothetical protein
VVVVVVVLGLDGGEEIEEDDEDEDDYGEDAVIFDRPRGRCRHRPRSGGGEEIGDEDNGDGHGNRNVLGLIGPIT